MINILSIRCALAFAPYLVEGAARYVDEHAAAALVVRQGGTGLSIRSDGDFLLRHQGREVALGPEEARHYLATLRLRVDCYDIKRMQDEVVMANFGDSLVLSHPQSEVWLDKGTVSEMLRACKEAPGVAIGAASGSLPDWLNISAGEDRLLLSDQRSGRWVLLGRDHLAELNRRLGSIRDEEGRVKRHLPPVIKIKGVNVHLQSASRLARTLESFAAAAEIEEFEEVTPSWTLSVKRATDGLEIKDTERRAAVTAKEARKWVDIIRAELERLNAAEFERGRIRTVFADGDGGRWALQWGDELFVEGGSLAAARSHSGTESVSAGTLRVEREDGFLLMLSEPTGAAVALTEAELTSF